MSRTEKVWVSSEQDIYQIIFSEHSHLMTIRFNDKKECRYTYRLVDGNRNDL